MINLRNVTSSNIEFVSSYSSVSVDGGHKYKFSAQSD